jgi:hypothetical protein
MRTIYICTIQMTIQVENEKRFYFMQNPIAKIQLKSNSLSLEAYLQQPLIRVLGITRIHRFLLDASFLMYQSLARKASPLILTFENCYVYEYLKCRRVNVRSHCAQKLFRLQHTMPPPSVEQPFASLVCGANVTGLLWVMSNGSRGRICTGARTYQSDAGQYEWEVPPPSGRQLEHRKPRDAFQTQTVPSIVAHCFIANECLLVR